MRMSRFAGKQIIAIPAEQERGMRAGEVCRRHGIKGLPARRAENTGPRPTEFNVRPVMPGNPT